MKQILQLAVLVFIFISNNTFSQTITSQKGLTTVEFTSSQGTIKVFLPDDIRPGDIISGTVKIDPVGNTGKKKQKAMDALSKSKLRIGNPYNANALTQPLTKLYPDKIQALDKITVSFPFAVSLTNDKNKTASIEIKPADLQKINSSFSCNIPTHALTGSPIRITGPFDGDASNTICSLDNGPLEVLAESPRQCFVSYLENVKGIQTLNVQESNQPKCSQQVSSVEMTVSAGKLNLQKEERTYIDISITGLQNLPDTAMLILNNFTSGVIIMQPSNSIEIPLIPDSVGSGIFNRRVDIQSIKTGTFTVNVNLDLPDNAPPVFADVRKPAGGKRDDGVLTAGTKTALEIGMKKWADANTEGKNPIDWECSNCFQCIKSFTFASNAGQVGTLGWGIITSFLSGGVKLAGGLLSKVKDIADKGGDIYKAIQELIDAGKIQVIGFKEAWCQNNEYCQVTGIIMYDVKTGCVEATYRCRGTKMCCPFGETFYKINYCLDKDGAVISETVSMSVSH